MHELRRVLLLISLVLLVPILPFLAFGPPLSEAVPQWLQGGLSKATVAVVVVVLLGTDVFLPVPSSVISTWGGAALGTLAGTAASWIGMNLGAAIGFAVARRWGRAVAERLAGENELERIDRLSRSMGPVILVVTRPIPVLAEASVLLLGIHQLSWRRFLPAVSLANLGIALGYSAFGQRAEKNYWLIVALCISAAFPLALAALLRGWGRTSSEP